MAFRLSLGLLSLPLMLTGLEVRADDTPPSDGWVVWESNRQDGRMEIYVAKADGSGVKRLTTGTGQRPRWSPDGRWISYGTIPENVAHVVRWDGTGDKKLIDAAPLFWMHDNTGVVCQAGGGEYKLVDPETGSSTTLFRQSEFSRVASSSFLPGGITHDGRYLIVGTDLFREGATADNGSFKEGFAATVLDLTDKSKVYFFGSGCWPFTPPAGDLIYHINGICPTHPDIYRMDLRDLMTRSSYQAEKAAPDEDWGHEYNPSISSDNTWLAYMASTGCHSGETCDYEIFLHRLGSGLSSRVRVTQDPSFDGYPDIYRGQLWPAGEGPRLSLAPRLLSFAGEREAQLVARTVAARNVQGGTLEPISVSVIYTEGDGWLEVKQVGSGNDQKLTVLPKTKSLADGRYHATIRVAQDKATASPQLCDVELTVQGGPNSPDGGPLHDARVTPPDGGPRLPEPVTTGGGGGCELSPRGGHGSSAAGWLLLLGLGLIRYRRKTRGS